MQPKKEHVLLIWLLLYSDMAEALEPVSATIAIGAAAGVTGILMSSLSCYFHECCQPEWISFDIEKAVSQNPWQLVLPQANYLLSTQEGELERNLDNKLFGQHIASSIILHAVRGFMRNKNPKKPLVLSLHGWPGTGKNFVSQFIAESIYKKGMKSRFVHLFTSTLHFPHKHRIDTYESQLQQWVRGNVTDCELSMFIFDEMDKMHPGLIDSIKPYLDYYDNLDGVSYGKSIFIFLSNEGGDDIAKTALEFWQAGKSREEIEDLQNTLSLSVYNNKNGGFFRTSLIDKHLVDFFIPFLPLEYEHVVQCAMAEMRARNLKPNRDVADRVAKEMVYTPKPERLYSSTGCKTVQNKLNFYI